MFVPDRQPRAWSSGLSPLRNHARAGDLARDLLEAPPRMVDGELVPAPKKIVDGFELVAATSRILGRESLLRVTLLTLARAKAAGHPHISMACRERGWVRGTAYSEAPQRRGHGANRQQTEAETRLRRMKVAPEHLGSTL
jgi:hypothetical protein